MSRVLDVVRTELERLFTLEEMLHMGVLLGIGELDGSTKAAFARALTERCFEGDLFDALVDVMFYARSSVDPSLRDLDALLRPELAVGTRVGPFTILRKIGTSMRGTVYLASRADGSDKALEVLGSKASRDRRAVHRFLTANRLVGTIQHAGLVKGIEAGEAEPGVYWVAHAYVEGEALQGRRASTWSVAQPVVLGILGPLAALHGAHVVHGGLHVENVIVVPGVEASRVTLVGFGTDHLFQRPADLQTDVQAFATLLRHLLDTAPPPRIAALLDAIDAGDGPRDAAAVLAELHAVERTSARMRASTPFPEDTLQMRIDALFDAVEDSERARELEASVDEGAAPDRVAEALVEASTKASAPETKIALLYRAARAFDDGARVEPLLVAVLALAPEDPVAFARLAEVRRKLGKYEDLAEMLLQKSESAPPGEDRGRVFAEIGRLYATELGEPEQAVIAFTRALCEVPGNDGYASEIERLAGSDAATWKEQLETMQEGEAPTLVVRIARWYDEKLGRVDMALDHYRRALEQDPTSEVAFEGIVAILRRTQRWTELVSVLTGRADLLGSHTPRARDILVRAADVLDVRLGEPRRAEDLLEKVLADDPGHDHAGEVMRTLAERAGSFRAFAHVLDRRARTRSGTRRAQVLVEAGEIHDVRLGDPDEAARRFEDAFALDPTNDGALEGLTRVLRRRGNVRELLPILEARAADAPTARRKIQLHERIAELHETELLDREGAVAAQKAILAIDATNERAATELERHWRALGQWEPLAAFLEELARIAPGRAAEALLTRARLLAAHAPDRAPDAFARVVVLDAKEVAVALVGAALDPGTRRALRDAYLARGARGDRAAAATLVEAEIRLADTDGERARAWGELARLESDRTRQASAAEKALLLDPANEDARLVLADLAHEDGRLAESAMHYDSLIPAAESLPAEDRTRVLVRFIETFATTQLPRSRLVAAAEALELPRSSLDPVVDALLAAGEPVHALRLSEALLGRVTADDRAAVLYRIGTSALQAFATSRAAEALRESAALGSIDARRIVGDVLLEAGDRAAALEAYRVALALWPRDRKLLTKAMQLHSENAEWSSVLEIVLRLADLVEDPTQRAKYMYTAGTIAAEHLADPDAALDAFGRALSFDPALEKAIADALPLRRARSEHREVERLLKKRLELARANDVRPMILGILDELGDVYRRHLNDRELAIDAYEAAQAFSPSDARAATLAALYGESMDFDKAVGAEWALLRKDPYRVESYKRLRKLYADCGRVDPAWCLTQALTLLRLADEEEQAFYRARRPGNPAPAKQPLAESDWGRLHHWDLDPWLTRVFALIEPAIVKNRTRPVPGPASSDPRVAHTVAYARGVLGMLAHPLAETVVIGAGAEDASEQGLAFTAGREVASLRPGFYVRHLVPTGTGLKGWLFAAIKTCVPQFAIPPELGGQVDEAMALLELGTTDREHLASAVAKLLQAGGALDLKKWVSAIDLTADRVGLLLAHDLQSATEVIREGAASPGVPVKQRMKDVVLFSISEDYFALRKKLGVSTEA